jgi:tetratricopeptide (TPR) repeat protein
VYAPGTRALEGVMVRNSSLFKAWLVVGVAVFAQTALAQPKPGTTPPGGNRPNIPTTRTQPTPTTPLQPTFISGKVLLEGGGTLAEPVAIERVCNGVTRREGYTDFKGQFEFQLGTNLGFQDASENDPSSTPGSPVKTTGTNMNQRPTDLTGCEFRAVFAGFVSSTAMIRTNGDNWQIDIGTIFLKRMGDAVGTTISITTMAAPKEAQSAYEKAQKAVTKEKPAEAEKELNKAVRLYPGFASAWALLGEIHRQQNQLDLARTEYTQAQAADPQFVNPTYGLTMISMQEKKWPEAIRFSEQVIRMNAYAYPTAYFFNAAANYNAQNFAAAEQSAVKFKSLDTAHSHPDVCLLLSYILSRKRDYAAAAQQIQDYLVLVPEAPNAESLKADAKRLQDLSTSA